MSGGTCTDDTHPFTYCALHWQSKPLGPCRSDIRGRAQQDRVVPLLKMTQSIDGICSVEQVDLRSATYQESYDVDAFRTYALNNHSWRLNRYQTSHTRMMAMVRASSDGEPKGIETQSCINLCSEVGRITQRS